LDSPSSYVFLSYAGADRERALRFADLLEAHGISVWIDRKSIAGGTSWSAEIVRGIEECTSVVVLCSAAAMASPNVQQELQLAWEHRRAILPLHLDQTPLPRAIEYVLAGRQWIEVLDLPEAEWLRLAVQALSGMGVVAAHSQAPGASGPSTVAPPVEPHRRNNLPIQATSFVGRARELAEVKDQLTRTRLLTLTGPGGCGKTRLAFQVAGDVLDAYPDGVWLVELAPLSDPTLVPQTVVAVLGLQDNSGLPAVAALTVFLKQRRLLLLLDNCEHLIDACASLASALIQSCPHLRILATSRELLGVPGESPWRVPSLAVPDPQVIRTSPTNAVALVGQSEAARLFLERAQVVAPRFQITEQNAIAVAQICQRLDGIPLAIELAAARVAVLTVEQIVARLDQRFRLLTGGSRTASRRQQTLQATIDWSYEPLSEKERLVLQRLAVFAGGCNLEAAEAVCSAGATLTPDTGLLILPDDVLDLLGSWSPSHWSKSTILVRKRAMDS
jgi:predicted ATPase